MKDRPCKGFEMAGTRLTAKETVTIVGRLIRLRHLRKLSKQASGRRWYTPQPPPVAGTKTTSMFVPGHHQVGQGNRNSQVTILNDLPAGTALTLQAGPGKN